MILRKSVREYVNAYVNECIRYYYFDLRLNWISFQIQYVAFGMFYNVITCTWACVPLHKSENVYGDFSCEVVKSSNIWAVSITYTLV